MTPRCIIVTVLFVVSTLFAQSGGPSFSYAPAPDPFQLPDGASFGPVSAVAVNAAGNIYVLNRGPHPLMEFRPDGAFVRYLAEGLLQRPHGLRVDPDGNVWVTDARAHIVLKMDPKGRVRLILGSQGAAGDFNELFKLPLLNEPTDVGFGPAGEIYVTEGHGGPAGRIRKFSKEGNLLASWGKKGSGLGEFMTPHTILVHEGLVYVADRENHRIQVFDGDGKFLKAFTSSLGSPNGLALGPDGALYSTDEVGGRVLKLDWDGHVLGETGSQGKGPGQFGEAHTLALDAQGNIYVADTLNWRVQKFSMKK